MAPVDGDDGATTIHEVGLFPGASEEGLEGVLRIVNRTRQAGRVSIEAIDDTGATFGPVAVYLSALKGLVLTSEDLEEGNKSKGLFTGTGAGTGDWRLRLSTSLEIEVQSYVYPLGVQDGLLSAMHTLVPRGAKGHRVTMFDPGEVTGSSGSLRLMNPSATEAAVTIRGVDGTGTTPGGEVRLTLGAGESREVTVEELEDGTGTGLVGALGDGTGRWHLSIESNRRIGVMSLLAGPGGTARQSVQPAGGNHSGVSGCTCRVGGHGDSGGGVQRAHLGAGGAVALYLLPRGGGAIGPYTAGVRGVDDRGPRSAEPGGLRALPVRGGGGCLAHSEQDPGGIARRRRAGARGQ